MEGTAASQRDMAGGSLVRNSSRPQALSRGQRQWNAPASRGRIHQVHRVNEEAGYGMSVAELEKRVAVLEKELAELRKLVAPEQPAWRKTFGVFANDPFFDAMVERGREWRAQANEDQGE